MEFREYIVAFADVLGASAASTEPAEAERFGKRLLVAHKMLSSDAGPSVTGSEPISMTYFSDSIILAGELAQPDSIARMLNKMALYQALLAVNGLFLRGGIAIGSYLKTATVDYGAPLVEAAQIEKNVSRNSAKICLSHGLAAFGRHFDLNVMADRSDNTVFLDFMSCLSKDVYIDRLRNNILHELNGAQKKYALGKIDNGVIEKLNWLANYFNFQYPRYEKIPCSEDGYDERRFQRNFVR